MLRQFGQADVARHVFQVGAIVLAHEEELARVAENGGANAALFEATVLLYDGNIPAVEFAQLRVALLDDFLAAGDVEEAGDFFVYVPFPHCAGQRDDVFASVIGDEEAGSGA